MQEADVTIDRLDRQIINLLIGDARLSSRDIARRLKISPATVIKRVRRLERERVIVKYTIGVRYSRIGYQMQAVIDLRIAKGKLHEVESKIATHPNVFAVYDVTGGSDAIVIAKFRTRAELDSFIKKVQTYDFVERTETKLLLSTIKEEMIRLPV
jgi:Lrp/AsnC family transcriptional regulator, regulator for asnA, asnC and gidA